MTLNFREAQSSAESAPATGSATGSATSERPLVNDVLAELSSWNPREFIAAFHRWHHGAISLIHLNVLMLLEAEGPLPMGRLAVALDVSVASATGIVGRMEKRGLVERRHDSEDRRVVLVHPAAGARDVFGEVDGRRRSGLKKLLDHLSDEDLAALLRGHRALRAAREAMAASHEGSAGTVTGDHAPATEAAER